MQRAGQDSVKVRLPPEIYHKFRLYVARKDVRSLRKNQERVTMQSILEDFIRSLLK